MICTKADRKAWILGIFEYIQVEIRPVWVGETFVEVGEGNFVFETDVEVSTERSGLSIQ